MNIMDNKTFEIPHIVNRILSKLPEGRSESISASITKED